MMTPVVRRTAGCLWQRDSEILGAWSWVNMEKCIPWHSRGLWPQWSSTVWVSLWETVCSAVSSVDSWWPAVKCLQKMLFLLDQSHMLVLKQWPSKGNQVAGHFCPMRNPWNIHLTIHHSTVCDSPCPILLPSYFPFPNPISFSWFKGCSWQILLPLFSFAGISCLFLPKNSALLSSS
jgi:hypothetical protein